MHINCFAVIMMFCFLILSISFDLISEKFEYVSIHFKNFAM
ncbi:hypothetical protein HMPREF2531_03918 [Bacteroides intestinalis]|uniref:Uncharacterized protein n=1 Tax=Bacteroides intestinalis TaxID=329854 RepID=A0A139KYW8_9BACE|nr:hypothetical protein HMPREF2531_03918 [Bacteroides intestinalis]